ncbi:polysaccharide deacetylase family protein [Tsukamurella serpentis]
MDRRRLLTVITAGAATALAGCSRPSTESAGPAPAAPSASAPAKLFGAPPTGTIRPRIQPGPITRLPGAGENLALTVDDGASPDVVGAYVRFAEQTGARLTFFVTGSFPAWTIHRQALGRLVESGQVQLGNHTWTHPALTRLGPRAIAHELQQTKDFLLQNFGVDGTPYYRPPFGYHSAAVDAVAADLGYTVPTLWYGSLSDSGLITEQYLLECAQKYFTAQAIVIGHANHPPVTRVFPQLTEIIRARRLQLVTLDDVLTGPPSVR